MRLVVRYRKNVGSLCALLAALSLSSSGIAQAPDATELAAGMSAEETAALAWTDEELVERLADIDEPQSLEVIEGFTEEESKTVRLWVQSVEAYNRGDRTNTLQRPTFLAFADFAQESVSGAVRDPDIEELVIRGTQTEGLGDVPIAVTQFSAADIQNLRIKDVADLAAYTPNLEINTAFAASNPTLFIRGIGLKDYNSNAAGAVSIWHDDVHMVSTASQLFSLFDVNNIEVLRGPQGGLRGRNASGGSIRIESAEPDGEFETWGTFTYGNFNNKEFEGAVGFPILPDVFNDTLSGRLAFVLGLRDGYLTNSCADWSPSDHVDTRITDPNNPFYGSNYIDLTRSSQQQIWEGGTDPTAPGGLYGLRPSEFKVRLYDINGVKLHREYVYFEGSLYEDLEERGIVPIAGGFRYVDVYPVSVDGTPATGLLTDKNTRVVEQGLADFELVSDNVCVQQSPGKILTYRGANKKGGNPGRFRKNGRALQQSDFAGLKTKLNDVDYMGARAMLRFQPTDTLDLLFTAHWGRNRSDSFHVQAVGAINKSIPEGIITEPLGFHEANTGGNSFDERNTGLEEVCAMDGLSPRKDNKDPTITTGYRGCDPFNGFYNLDGYENIDLLGFSLRTTWELETGRVRSITAYEESDRDTLDDGDDCPCGIGSTSSEYIDNAWQASQELIIEGEGENYTWATGGYVMHDELNSQNISSALAGQETNQFYEATNTSWNIGGEFHYDFLEEGEIPGLYQLSVEAKTRYNWEHKIFGLVATVARTSVPGSLRDTLPAQKERKTWQAPTGSFALQWKPVENATVYAKYTRGQKAGHFNASLTSSGGKTSKQSIDPVKSEHIHAAEIGFNMNAIDGALKLNGALFRYWYESLQIFDIINEPNTLPTQQLLNSDANVIGFEIEGQFTPPWWFFEGLNLEGGFGWLDSEFVDFFVEKGVTAAVKSQPAQTRLFDYSGNPLIASPEWNWSGVVEWDFPIGEWGFIVPRWDFSYKSEVFLDPTMEEAISQEPFWLHHLRLSYRSPDGNFEVSGWIQNLFKEEYKVDVFDLTRGFNIITQVWGEPRTYGITLSLNW